MNMGRIAVIVLFSVFNAATVCFAANDFQIKGTVSTINGNVITITDDKGNQITFEGSLTNINAGDRVTITAQIKKAETIPAQLTSENIEFLKQCLIDQADIGVIPQLNNDGRRPIFSAIKNKSCEQLAQYKTSREYFKKLDVNKAIPLAPARWSIDYLTKEEFKQYTDILENAPW